MWVLTPTPANDTFNGVSAPNSDFVIAVGENGTIVHFIAGDSGTVMPSGTTEELFDVYASSPHLAVATGAGKVLLWDGSNWSTLRTETNDVIFTGTWITPEEDAIFYGILGDQFSFVCPEIPGDPDPLFCRTFGRPMLTACGNSNDIKLITTEGDIYHIDNYLGDVNGSDPIHDEPLPLSLDGVWFPYDACVPGPIAPLEAFAIRNHVIGELWHFDGSSWNNMNVNVPADQTFTWIGGISTRDVYAVGFKPDNMGGNSGVVWHYDGNSWTEDMTLPVGTPGLTDIAATISAPDFIFMNGFETNINRMANGQLPKIDILAIAEHGVRLNTPALFNANYTDVLVEKTRLTTGPFTTGDSITYQILLQNVGDTTATDIRFYDGFNFSMEHVSNTCGLSQYSENAGWEYFEAQVANLAPNEVWICFMTLTISGQVGDEISNYVTIHGVNDYNRANNHSNSNGVFIVAPEQFFELSEFKDHLKAGYRVILWLIHPRF